MCRSRSVLNPTLLNRRHVLTISALLSLPTLIDARVSEKYENVERQPSRFGHYCCLEHNYSLEHYWTVKYWFTSIVWLENTLKFWREFKILIFRCDINFFGSTSSISIGVAIDRQKIVSFDQNRTHRSHYWRRRGNTHEHKQ